MEIEESGLSEKDRLINRLAYYLNYELSSVLLYFLSFMYNIAVFIATLAAVIFTPFLIYVLIKTKKFGWLTSFVLLIFLPAIILIFTGIKSQYLMILTFILLGLFYLYCFTLRMAVYDWTEKIKWGAILKMQMRKAKLERLRFKEQFENKKKI